MADARVTQQVANIVQGVDADETPPAPAARVTAQSVVVVQVEPPPGQQIAQLTGGEWKWTGASARLATSLDIDPLGGLTMPFLGRIEVDPKTFPAGDAVAMHSIVQLGSDGKVTVAGAADASIGVAERAAAADGDEIAVRLWSAPEQIGVATGAIAVAAAVYQAAGGQVSGTGTVQVGVATTAAAAANDLITYVRASA